MPPRKKTKKNLNKPFVIHRDESCLSSNNSQQDQDAEVSPSAPAPAILTEPAPTPGHETRDIPASTIAWGHPLEHEELDSEHSQVGESSQIIYSDPDEPRWSELDEIAEETEPESTRFEESRYKNDLAADTTPYNHHLDQSSHMDDSRGSDSQLEAAQAQQDNRYADDSQVETSGLSHGISTADHCDHDDSQDTAEPSLLVESVVQEDCSLLNHSIDQSYNAETDRSRLQPQSHYDITDSHIDQDTSTPRPRQDSSSPLQEEEEEEDDHDDVFSDHSLRSSLGSYDSGMARKAVVEEAPSVDASSVYMHEDSRMPQAARPTHVSDFSQSLISETDDDDSTLSSKDSLCSHFRSGSNSRQAYMSPTAGSSRSSKNSGPKSVVTRLGSPAMPVHYSPKGRTPTRFRPQPDQAPLVLLHVTMLPLQWSWAPVLEEAAAYAAEGNSMLSEPIKNLRDAWIILQDRIGDTVLERGVLLPHPQNDYEVLEERVLEAMELPLRRRARILECGHYLGPANVMSLSDDEETEDDDSFTSYEIQRRRITSTRHWCATCRHEIKVDALGPGKIFRVKVYASNGLMRAGAWKACWREMERIDVEIEPIVDSSLHIELAELAAEQQRRAEETASKMLQEKKEAEAASRGIVAKIDDKTRRLNEERERREIERELERHREEVMRAQPKALTSPPPAIPIEAPPCPSDQSRSSGQFTQSTPHNESSSSHPPPSPSASVPLATSPGPQSPLQRTIPDTFPELLMEALRVLIRDRKNIVIGVLSFLALLLAVRGGQQQNYMHAMHHDHFPGRSQAYAAAPYADTQPPAPAQQQQPQMQHQNVPPVQYYQQQQQHVPQQVEYQAQAQQQAVGYREVSAQDQQYAQPEYGSAQNEQPTQQQTQYEQQQQQQHYENAQYDYPHVEHEQQYYQYDDIQAQDESPIASPGEPLAVDAEYEAPVDVQDFIDEAIAAEDSVISTEALAGESVELETEANSNFADNIDGIDEYEPKTEEEDLYFPSNVSEAEHENQEHDISMDAMADVVDDETDSNTLEFEVQTSSGEDRASPEEKEEESTLFSDEADAVIQGEDMIDGTMSTEEEVAHEEL
ncbi:hypothetical protein HOO65_010905 [Ceratocystis lukuohia]|uniref:Pathway-specific nitrogen regulator n=1 Tax=Ceratocystis lukuohia TaxID=2019550 RepID=A0ABR4MTD6_9PEZI